MILYIKQLYPADFELLNTQKLAKKATLQYYWMYRSFLWPSVPIFTIYVPF